MARYGVHHFFQRRRHLIEECVFTIRWNVRQPHRQEKPSEADHSKSGAISQATSLPRSSPQILRLNTAPSTEVGCCLCHGLSNNYYFHFPILHLCNSHLQFDFVHLSPHPTQPRLTRILRSSRSLPRIAHDEGDVQGWSLPPQSGSPAAREGCLLLAHSPAHSCFSRGALRPLISRSFRLANHRLPSFRISSSRSSRSMSSRPTS